MGNFGRLKSTRDLPPGKIIINFLKKAKKLNEEGEKYFKKEESREVV